MRKATRKVINDNYLVTSMLPACSPVVLLSDALAVEKPQSRPR